MTTTATIAQGAGSPILWRTDFLRALILIAGATLLGLLINQISNKPVPLLASDGPGAPPGKAPRITLAELKEALRDPKTNILDVRSEKSFAAGHAASAINAPAEDFISHYGRLNLNAYLSAAKTIVVMCQSERCPSADRVARLLSELKHANVRVLQGGWSAYRKFGLDTADGAGEE